MSLREAAAVIFVLVALLPLLLFVAFLSVSELITRTEAQFAAFMALQEHYIAQVMGKPMTWDYTFRAEFTYAYLWALLTPCVLWLAKHFPVGQRNWYRAAPLHLAACVLIVTVHRSAYVLLIPVLVTRDGIQGFREKRRQRAESKHD